MLGDSTNLTFYLYKTDENNPMLDTQYQLLLATGINALFYEKKWFSFKEKPNGSCRTEKYNKRERQKQTSVGSTME